jgi:rubrerythrin
MSSSMSNANNKRTYKKAPIVIKQHLNGEEKKQLIKCVKNMIKKSKENKKIAIKEEKDNKKKMQREENKKRAMEKDKKFREIAKSLTNQEKKNLLSIKYKNLLVTCSDTDLALDIILQETSSSIYIGMIKNGLYQEMKEEIVTRIEI